VLSKAPLVRPAYQPPSAARPPHFSKEVSTDATADVKSPPPRSTAIDWVEIEDVTQQTASFSLSALSFPPHLAISAGSKNSAMGEHKQKQADAPTNGTKMDGALADAFKVGETITSTFGAVSVAVEWMQRHFRLPLLVSHALVDALNDAQDSALSRSGKWLTSTTELLCDGFEAFPPSSERDANQFAAGEALSAMHREYSALEARIRFLRWTTAVIEANHFELLKRLHGTSDLPMMVAKDVSKAPVEVMNRLNPADTARALLRLHSKTLSVQPSPVCRSKL
jgi:hypothetical protein